MGYQFTALPFKYRKLGVDLNVAISVSGDHIYLSDNELNLAVEEPHMLPVHLLATMQSRFFFENVNSNDGSRRLLKSRISAKRETVSTGPTLHIIVITLHCEHSCRYCQVSRSRSGNGFTITTQHLNAACDTVFQSSAKTLTVEFQGGDPLLRFDLIKHAITRLNLRNKTEQRQVRFVVASTLSNLTEEMCEFFKEHRVILSTSIDGGRDLHNKNRPSIERNSYNQTLAGIKLARKHLGHESVSALMTTTRDSLSQPEDIVDEYVRLGFCDVFLRPLSSYGFAKKNKSLLAYEDDSFFEFYVRGIERVLHWNKQGTQLREVYASIILNKILSIFDAGYVNLQSPTGAGLSALIYNYDGYVYPSDEARMLLETGDSSLRLGNIGMTIDELHSTPLQKNLIASSLVESNAECVTCAYNLFCAPDPIDAYAEFGTFFAQTNETSHCRRHKRLFDFFYKYLNSADDQTMDIFCRWAIIR